MEDQEGAESLGNAPTKYIKQFVTGYGIVFPDITKRARDVPPERIQVTWNRILSSLNVSPRSVVIFFGAKNNGKSSLVRYIVNEMVKVHNNTSSSSSSYDYVYYMDCDPGQSEMTTPGLVSAHLIKYGERLYTPPYLNTLQHEPVAVSSVAGTNMSTDPKIYIDVCQFVFLQIQRHMRESHKQRPIFINTMGHIRNVGLAMQLDLIKLVQPTDVIVLNVRDDANRTIFCDFRPLAVAKSPTSFLDESISSGNSGASLSYNLHIEDLEFAFVDSHVVASKNRLASTLAYLAYIPEALYMPIEKTPLKYLRMDGLLTHCASSFPLKPSIVLDLLPNSWVHLCQIDSNQVSLSKAANLKNNQHHSHLILAQNIRNNTCYGCAVIINLDLEKSLMSLITPLDQATLDLKINLVIKPLSIQAPSTIYSTMDAMDE